MTRHFTTDEIASYVRKTMAPKDLIAASDHLAGCEICRDKLTEAMGGVNRSGALARAILSLPRNDHLSCELLAGYVDRTLAAGERDSADAHLETCLQCKAELRELEHFRAEIERAPSTVARADLFTQLRGWFKSPMAWVAVPAAVAATVLIIVSLSPRPGQVSRAVAAVTDAGRPVSVDSSGRVHGLDRLSPADETAVRAALTAGQVERYTGLPALLGTTGVLLGEKEDTGFEVIEPVGTRVAEDRPTFSWKPLPGAGGYTVAVFDVNLRRIAESPRVKDTAWMPHQPLPCGATYLWQVTARKNGVEFIAPAPPSPQARFAILSETEVAQLAREKQVSGSSHLLMGMAYARLGLMRDATREFQLLADENPGSPAVARLLESIGNTRR